MRIYRVSETAIADMGEAYEYVARDNETAAEDLLSEFQKRFRLLADFPAAGRERNDLMRGVRSYAVGNYVVLYRQVEEGVEILRVLHGARDIQGLFGAGE